MTQTDNITELLARMHEGDKDVVSRILPAVHGELRRLARMFFRNDRVGEVLDPSDLVQDAALRIFMPGAGPWNNREHFFAIAAINIRRCLIDRARAIQAEKRGGAWKRVELDEALPAPSDTWNELLDVDEALRRLEALNPRVSQVVELRIFAGMRLDEIAVALGVSRSTVKEDWNLGTAFLRRELGAYCDAASMGAS